MAFWLGQKMDVSVTTLKKRKRRKRASNSRQFCFLAGRLINWRRRRRKKENVSFLMQCDILILSSPRLTPMEINQKLLVDITYFIGAMN